MMPPAAGVRANEGGGLNEKPIAAGWKPPGKTLLAAAEAVTDQPSSTDEAGKATPGQVIETPATPPMPGYLGNAGVNQKNTEQPADAPAGTAAAATKVFPRPVTAVSPSKAGVVDKESTATEAAAPAKRGKIRSNKLRTATTAAAAPAENGKNLSKKLTSTGAKDDLGAVERVRNEGDRGAPGSTSHPAKDYPKGALTYTSETSYWIACKRTALSDLERADTDRVRQERDFRSKDVRFDHANAAHTAARERWTWARKDVEVACNASKGFLFAEKMARQEHTAARRDKRAAEAGLMAATENSTLAQTAVLWATAVFQTAKQNASVQHCQETLATVRLRTPRIFENSGGGADSLGKELATKSQKGPLPDLNNGVADTALPTAPAVTTSSMMTIRPQYAAEVTHDGGGGETYGGSTQQEKGHQPAGNGSTTSTNNAFSEEGEVQRHAEGLHARLEIMAHATPPAAAIAAQAAVLAAEVKQACRVAQQQRLDSTPPALEAAPLGVDTMAALPVAARKMNDAIESAKHASAVLDSTKAALNLSMAVLHSTAVAHRNAINNARPYVSLVNKKMAAQRSLQARSRELMNLAVSAWNTRQEAREELLKAEDRVSRATRVLKSFSTSDAVDGIIFEPVGETNASATDIQQSN